MNCEECNDTGKITANGVMESKEKVKVNNPYSFFCPYCAMGVSMKREITEKFKT